MKGLFITFEGGEGAGKSTLIEGVYQALRSKRKKVIKTREPGGTPLGGQIRKLLLGGDPLSSRSELLLFLADRAHHVDTLILPALKKGEIILCDRFTDSTLAYQGGARGLPMPLVQSLCRFAAAKLKPHLTIYLDIDPEIGLSRTKKSRSSSDRIESETLAFHEATRKTFLSLAEAEPRRFFVLDASYRPDVVLRRALERIDALLGTKRQRGR